jgi:hypothetical protein
VKLNLKSIYFGSEIPTAVTMEGSIFLEEYAAIHLQGQRVSQARWQQQVEP